MLDPPIRVVYAQTMGGPNIIRKTFRVLVSLIAVTAFSSTPAETIRSIRTQIGEAWHIQDMANSASGAAARAGTSHARLLEQVLVQVTGHDKRGSGQVDHVQRDVR